MDFTELSVVRFRDALDTQTEQFEVICYPWQVEFLRAYLGSRVRLKLVEMEVLEQALGI